MASGYSRWIIDMYQNAASKSGGRLGLRFWDTIIDSSGNLVMTSGNVTIGGDSGGAGATPPTYSFLDTHNSTTTTHTISSQFDFKSSDTSGSWIGGETRARIASIWESTSGASMGISFFTSSSDAILIEAMRINELGNVDHLTRQSLWNSVTSGSNFIQGIYTANSLNEFVMRSRFDDIAIQAGASGNSRDIRFYSADVENFEMSAGGQFKAIDTNVAHGITNVLDTDVWFDLRITNAGVGGATLTGASETGRAMLVRAYQVVPGSEAAIEWRVGEANGTGIQAFQSPATDVAYSWENFDGSSTFMRIFGDGSSEFSGNLSLGVINSGFELRLRRGFANNVSGGSGISPQDHTGANDDGLALYGHDGMSFFTSQDEKMRISTNGTFTYFNQSSGGDVTFRSNTTTQTLDMTGELRFLSAGANDGTFYQDGVEAKFGSGRDARIKYTGTNLEINPQVAGSGHVNFTQGRVGIGRSPDTLFHIDDTSPAFRFQDNRNITWVGGEILSVIETKTSDGSGSGAGILADIRVVNRRAGTSPNGTLEFFTRDRTLATLTKAMTIDANQRVGIGIGTIADRFHIFTPNAGEGQIIESSDGGTLAGPFLDLYRNSSSPADGDELGRIEFSGETSTGAKITYANIRVFANSVNNASPNGRILYQVQSDGLVISALEQIGLDTTEVEYHFNNVDDATAISSNAHAFFINDQIHKDSSTRRIKDNIRDQDFIDTSKIWDLELKAYETKRGDSTFGWIAEEVYEVLPQITWNDKKGRVQGVAKHLIFQAMYQEMKYLRERVAVLEAAS